MSRIAPVLLVLSFAHGCAMQQNPGQEEGQMHIPGTYVTQGPDGERYALVLNPDGTGHINGQPGTWQVQFGRIFLSDGQNYVPADLVGDQLTVHLPDGAVVLVRESGGGAVAAGQVAGGAPAAPAAKFAPEKTLAGDVVALQGTGAEFTVPDGWSHGPTKNQDGSEAYGLQPKDGSAGGIVLSRKILSGTEQKAPVPSLLQQAVQQLIAGREVETVLAAEELEIAGQRGARTILRGTISGRQMELYAAGVVVGHYGFLIAGLYEAGKSDEMRPAVDTVLSTFRGSVPAENAELRARLVGCWENFQSGNSGNGGFNSTTRLALRADGTYAYRYSSSVTGTGGGGAERDNQDAGRFRVEGNTVVGVSDRSGDGVSYQVSFQGGILYLGGAKYLPCNG
jgi:hypothetical protein